MCGVLTLWGCGDDTSSEPADDAGHVHEDGSSGDGSHQDGSDQDDAGSGGDVESCFDALSAPAAGFLEVQTFRAAEHGLQLKRARQPGDRSAVGETFPYDLVRVQIATDDDAACVSDAAAMTYEFGHHNWDETWSVRTDKARYVGREKYSWEDPEQPWTDTLEARSLEDDSLLWGPVALEAAGCMTLPYDLNPCLMRERTDKAPEGWGQE